MILLLIAIGVPLPADTPNAIPAPDREDFGKYLADHQDELAPFFSDNAGDIFRLGVPVIMSMLGWVIVCTMLVGWGIDVLVSRGFSFFYAPAFANIKRSLIYATGRLFLSFVYTLILSLAIIFSLKFPYAGIVMAVVVLLLVLVALAAQVVWILYLYRTSFITSVLFYLVIVVVHTVVGTLVAKSVIGLRATGTITDFVDQTITPRLRADAATVRQRLLSAQADRDAVRAKVNDFQGQITQTEAEQDQLRKQIEEKKNSDIYVFSKIVQARARGELVSARDQFAAFPAKFPSSALIPQAQAQLAQVSDQISANQAQKKQADAEAMQAVAQARADLLARAGRGEVTLSEMRRALIGKTRDQVSNLLGPPPKIATDSWSYPQRMILNPLTNEKFGLTVYFAEGTVQGVDYNRNLGVAQ